MKKLLALAIVLCLTFVSYSSAAERKTNVSDTSGGVKGRKGKLLPIFQIINFQNNGCASNSAGRNGTCYTANECTDLGGTSSGSCAEGFGVCCLFSLQCGGSSNQNCTFMTQKSVTSVTDGRCEYKICKCSSDVCRIRLDFTTFDIAGPVVETTLAAAAAPLVTTHSQCLKDKFVVSAPGNQGSPLICGYNTGQHMYLDASDACHTLGFDITAGDSSSRSWDIKVTQYKCGHALAGEDGCLQYHTGTSGTIANFNFPTDASMIGPNTQHLNNQHYNICIRRESGYCAICYGPAVAPVTAMATPNNQASFGLSDATITVSKDGTSCSLDYITIPTGMQVSAIVAFVLGEVKTAIAANFANQFCGRALGTADLAYIQGSSVCTQTFPFRVGVNFDSTEIAAEEVQAAAGGAGGITGFKLDYRQIAC